MTGEYESIAGAPVRALAQDYMALHWTIDSKERLVVAVAEGNLTREEIEGYVAAIAGANVLAYRKLFDGSRADTSMGPNDLMALGAVFRGLHAQGPVGPLAVVVPDDKVELVSRVLGILAAADRPMRVFREVAPARRWIESLPKEQS